MRQQLPIALLLAASTAACVDNAPSAGEPTQSDVTSALEQENGGFDESDELPMFDQPAAFQAAAIEDDDVAADEMASDPRVSSIENLATAARHRVLVAWGRMPADPDATTGRNWSGSITTSRGALVVGRTIGFEELGDQLLPRQSPDRVDFRSFTRPHADGMILRLADPDPTAGPLQLTYTSADGAHTFDLDLAQLATGPLSIDAGDGNRVIAVALRDREGCDHGFMRGRWVALREHLGAYRGVIANADGEPIGHIRGIWGQRQTGEHVMFGKFIGNEGEFRGILAGTYENGHWRARWITRTGEHGVAGGLYFPAPDVRGGVFGGRFAETGCAN